MGAVAVCGHQPKLSLSVGTSWGVPAGAHPRPHGGVGRAGALEAGFQPRLSTRLVFSVPSAVSY